MSQAFTPKLFDNLGIKLELRWLFAVCVITYCYNWMKNLSVVYQQLLKTAKRKQNTNNGLWMVEKHDIMFEI